MFANNVFFVFDFDFSKINRLYIFICLLDQIFKYKQILVGVQNQNHYQILARKLHVRKNRPFQRPNSIKMKFAKRPKNQKCSSITDTFVRINSFELEAKNISFQKIKIKNAEKTISETKIINYIIKKSKEIIKPSLGEQILIETQLVTSKSKQSELLFEQAHDGITYSISIVKNDEINEEEKQSQKEQIINRLFNRAQALSGQTKIGKRFFDISGKVIIDIENNISIITGQSSSIHIKNINGVEKIFLEVDTSQKVQFDKNALNSIEEMDKNLNGNLNKQTEIIHKFCNKYFITEYDTMKAQKIVDIDFNLTPDSEFTLYPNSKTPENISQKDQLYRRYQIKCNSANQPLLVALVKRGKGGKEEKVYLLPEFCRETGLNDELRENSRFMIEQSKIKPNASERVTLYSDFINKIFEDQQSLFEIWGIILKNSELTHVKGGQINPGKIKFGQNITHDLKSNSLFEREAQNSIYSFPGKFKWAILQPDWDKQNEEAKEILVKELQSACKRAKVSLSEPIMQACEKDSKKWLDHMENLRMGDFILLILPYKSNDQMDLYKLTKRLAIAEFGIPTQCILAFTLLKRRVNVIAMKLLTQIVCKINNGAAWGLVNPECSEIPTMICGVDAQHNIGSKSIMGFTASLDASFSKQTSEAKMQSIKEELAAEISSCVIASCEDFKTLNLVQPRRIIVQRDGVSQGQLSTVLNQEVATILDCLIQSKIDATLTQIIVNKRVNSKILSQRRDESCAEGTIVDEVITRRDLQDFYLVPLFSRTGLANPVHQTILWDGSQDVDELVINQGDLYALSYKLCFMQQNWTGPVRVPAPCMFSHKLAYLLGSLQDKDKSQMPNDKLKSSVSCWQL